MKRILIVDDEPMVLSSTQHLLEILGYQTETTSDPSTIVRRARETRPDAILQDVRMPGLDLDGLLAELRADPVVGHVPVILFSAGMDLVEVQQRVHAAAVLEKPFKPQQALDVIEDVTA